MVNQEERKLLSRVMKKTLTEEKLMNYAKGFEKRGYGHSAAILYSKAYNKYGTKKAYNSALAYAEKADKEGLIHSAEEIYSELGLRPKSIDSIVSAIMLIGGIFALASFLSATQQIAVQNAQLAPPMPNIPLIAIGALLIVGIVYFMATRVFRRKVSIPLSFQ